jgi:anti-sigma regulatory factor (Ser/Thr protein kinase)
MNRQVVTLAAEPGAPRAARAWLARIAEGLLEAGRLADLELAVSELVTNAIRHGKGTEKIVLAATPKAEFLCVQVTDEGPGLAPRPRAMAADEDGGFGLFIVEQLTRRWGVTREGRQTRVWFEFDYRPPAARSGRFVSSHP